MKSLLLCWKILHALAVLTGIFAITQKSLSERILYLCTAMGYPCCVYSWKLFQHSDRNFCISAQSCHILYLPHWNMLFSLLFCPTKLTACQVNPCPWPVITGLQKKSYLQAWRRNKNILKIFAAHNQLLKVSGLNTSPYWGTRVFTVYWFQHTVNLQNLKKPPENKKKCGQGLP